MLLLDYKLQGTNPQICPTIQIYDTKSVQERLTKCKLLLWNLSFWGTIFHSLHLWWTIIIFTSISLSGYNFSLNPVTDDKYLIECEIQLIKKRMYMASITIIQKQMKMITFAEAQLCANHYARDFHITMFNTLSSLKVF